MKIAIDLVRPNWRVGVLGAVLLLGTGVSGHVQAEGLSTKGCYTEIRREFETRGPKSPGTWVTRRVQVCPSASESFKRASPDRRRNLARN